MKLKSESGDDEDEDSEDEGLRLLLGGISIADLPSPAAWEISDEELKSCGVHTTSDSNHSENRMKPSTVFKPKKVSIVTPTYPCNDADKDDLFSHAFHFSPDGRCVTPPVVVVDMSSVNNRGNTLVASRNIRQGEIIYTEKASVATQIPHGCLSDRVHQRFRVRGCQNCFRSLESVSSFNLPSAPNETGEALTLPLPHLWPVPEHTEYKPFEEGRYTAYLKDQFGRVICQKCGSTFCSVRCRDSHNMSFGKCCNSMASIQAIVRAFHESTNTSCSHESSGETNGVCCDLMVESGVHPSVFVATRLFCMELHMHRTGESTRRAAPGDGMCGDAENLTPLEIGWVSHAKDETLLYQYSLEPAYESVSTVLQLTSRERQCFPLKYFHRLAAVAARNSFEVSTQSPFQLYYTMLMSAVGGRGTDRHKDAMERIAKVLGSQDGALCRDMDEKIADRCVIRAACLFKLTARANHSCDPCAEVREQQFVDCRVDLVAKKDIERGQEISISYMNFGRMCGRAHDAAKRKRELQARYLFVCDCSRCSHFKRLQ